MTQYLKALQASDFIESYVPFGKKKRDEQYKLTDPFCIFWLKFLNGNDSKGNEHFWQENCNSQSVTSWRGFAFENLCFNHIDQIKKALNISGVTSKQSSWFKKDDDGEGTQVDLIIDRNDNIVDMCEIKFYSDEFIVNKSYYRTIMNRQAALSEIIPKKKSVHNILISTYGLKYNEYSGIFAKSISLEDLLL